MKSASNLPVATVTLANVSIPIFARTDIKHGITYRGFFFTHTKNGKRTQTRRRTIEEVKAEARKIVEDASRHHAHNREISLAEFADFSSATQMLRPHPGTTLAKVVAEWVQAQTALEKRGTIPDAISAFLRVTAEKTMPQITVPQLVKEFIAAKQSEGLSDAYLSDVSRRLKLFAVAFRTNIRNVQTAEIAVWLKSLKATGRNFNNYRNAVCTLFSFARERGFLPRQEKTEVELLGRSKEQVSEIGIYTPDQIGKLLNSAPDALAPSIAIGAFAGLRMMEIFRLDWKQVRTDKGHLEVLAKNAKTAQRRLVPIAANLADWLAQQTKREGRVTPNYQNLTNLSRAVSDACKAAGIEMVGNGLRHSYASYRLASVKSADQVALEMGNSPRKLFQNYREIVTEADAEKWFSVRPAGTPAKRG